MTARTKSTATLGSAPRNDPRHRLANLSKGFTRELDDLGRRVQRMQRVWRDGVASGARSARRKSRRALDSADAALFDARRAIRRHALSGVVGAAVVGMAAGWGLGAVLRHTAERTTNE